MQPGVGGIVERHTRLGPDRSLVHSPLTLVLMLTLPCCDVERYVRAGSWRESWTMRRWPRGSLRPQRASGERAVDDEALANTIRGAKLDPEQ
jgi:hypothetical protein